MQQYAIADIHGCLKTFKSLLDTIQFSTEDELFILGDFVDRGPNSKGVIDHIWKLQKEGYQIHCLRGNHDQMMLNAKSNQDLYEKWLVSGGRETFDNFKVDHIHKIPEEYFSWIESLPLYLETGKYIFVHAGLKFEKENPFEEEHAMMWQRGWYEDINYEWLGERVIVHGHTPITKAEVENMLNNLNEKRYLDIDAGCVHKGKKEGLGDLACLVMNEDRLIFEENRDF